MPNHHRRKCCCCGLLYLPDRRNAYHQCYCSQPACRVASRQASQRRWLARPENRGYHRGAVAVARTRAWRLAHPEHGRRKAALQDVLSAQVIPVRDVTPDLDPFSAGVSSGCETVTAPPAPVPATAQVPASAAVVTASGAVEPPPGAVSGPPRAAPLQDLYLSEDPLFVGLIALITGALQEDLAPTLANLQIRGRALLRHGVANRRPGVSQHADA
jgi:hypothetical protein